MNGPVSESQLVSEAREEFFAQLEYGGGGGYAERWFRLELGPPPWLRRWVDTDEKALRLCRNARRRWWQVRPWGTEVGAG